MPRISVFYLIPRRHRGIQHRRPTASSGSMRSSCAGEGSIHAARFRLRRAGHKRCRVTEGFPAAACRNTAHRAASTRMTLWSAGGAAIQSPHLRQTRQAIFTVDQGEQGGHDRTSMFDHFRGPSKQSPVSRPLHTIDKPVSGWFQTASRRPAPRGFRAGFFTRSVIGWALPKRINTKH
jgi:hypothetical protein